MKFSVDKLQQNIYSRTPLTLEGLANAAALYDYLSKKKTGKLPFENFGYLELFSNAIKAGEINLPRGEDTKKKDEAIKASTKIAQEYKSKINANFGDAESAKKYSVQENDALVLKLKNDLVACGREQTNCYLRIQTAFLGIPDINWRMTSWGKPLSVEGTNWIIAAINGDLWEKTCDWYDIPCHVSNVTFFKNIYNTTAGILKDLDVTNPKSWIRYVGEKYGDSALISPMGYLLKYGPKLWDCGARVDTWNYWICVAKVYLQFIGNTFPADEFMIVVNFYYGNYAGGCVAAVRYTFKKILWVLDQDVVQRTIGLDKGDVENVKLIVGILLASTDLAQIIITKKSDTFKEPATYHTIGGALSSATKTASGEPSNDIVAKVGRSIAYNAEILATFSGYTGEGSVADLIKKKYLDPVKALFTQEKIDYDSIKDSNQNIADSLSLAAASFGALAQVIEAFLRNEVVEYLMIKEVGDAYRWIAGQCRDVQKRINDFADIVHNALNAALASRDHDYIGAIKYSALATIKTIDALGLSNRTEALQVLSAIINATEVIHILQINRSNAFRMQTLYIAIGNTLTPLGGTPADIGRFFIFNSDIISYTASGNTASAAELIRSRYSTPNAALAQTGIRKFDGYFGAPSITNIGIGSSKKTTTGTKSGVPQLSKTTTTAISKISLATASKYPSVAVQMNKLSSLSTKGGKLSKDMSVIFKKMGQYSYGLDPSASTFISEIGAGFDTMGDNLTEVGNALLNSIDESRAIKEQLTPIEVIQVQPQTQTQSQPPTQPPQVIPAKSPWGLILSGAGSGLLLGGPVGAGIGAGVGAFLAKKEGRK